MPRKPTTRAGRTAAAAAHGTMPAPASTRHAGTRDSQAREARRAESKAFSASLKPAIDGAAFPTKR